MPVVPDHERIATLREWGISEPLIRLSCGEVLHDRFGINCKGPPWYVYHGSVPSPDGPPLAALWEWSEQVTGVRRSGCELEFIRYAFGFPDDFEVLAHTEQGFWVTQFDFLYECEAPLNELRDAAAIVGFRFMDRHLSSREEAGAQLNTFEGHATWLRELVSEIDRESGDSV